MLREMTSRGDAESVRRRRPGQERSGRRGSQDISKYWLVDRLVDRGRRWQGKRLAERCERLGGNGSGERLVEGYGKQALTRATAHGHAATQLELITNTAPCRLCP